MGETLFNGNCVTCHALSVPNSAPSTKEIQTAYKKAFDTKEKFVTFMVDWIRKPNSKTAIMQDAVKKYELMPNLGYDRDSLQEIASFLYDVELQ